MTTRSELLSARVPRYTSYPTAPHFHGGVTPDTLRQWLEELLPDAPLSLYLHVPFCDTLCWFCGCHTKVVNHYRPVGDYLNWLSLEIDRVADVFGEARRVSHIHWGGGSPTLLEPSDIRRLSHHLGERFEMVPGCEFAVEIDPRGLSDETIAALAESGLTRASIGVQDCDERVQHAINRIQPMDVTRGAVDRLRAAGIGAINIDVMYGLPYQTVDHVRATIEATLALEPQRYAVFGYAHVPSFKKHQALIRDDTLPGPEERFQQAEVAYQLLRRRGYAPIGLDHFARSDDALAIASASSTLKRNFQGYTTDTSPALIGFGASAISSLPQGYAQNATDVPNYRRALATGNLATAKGIELSADDRLRRAVIERLMCDMEIDLAEIARAHGRDPAIFLDELELLGRYATEGMLRIEGCKIAIPPENRVLVRVAAAIFDTYLRGGAARHSVAV